MPQVTNASINETPKNRSIEDLVAIAIQYWRYIPMKHTITIQKEILPIFVLGRK